MEIGMETRMHPRAGEPAAVDGKGPMGRSEAAPPPRKPPCPAAAEGEGSDRRAMEQAVRAPNAQAEARRTVATPGYAASSVPYGTPPGSGCHGSRRLRPMSHDQLFIFRAHRPL